MLVLVECGSDLAAVSETAGTAEAELVSEGPNDHRGACDFETSTHRRAARFERGFEPSRHHRFVEADHLAIRLDSAERLHRQCPVLGPGNLMDPPILIVADRSAIAKFIEGAQPIRIVRGDGPLAA